MVCQHAAKTCFHVLSLDTACRFSPQILDDNAEAAFFIPIHSQRTPCFAAAGITQFITLLARQVCCQLSAAHCAQCQQQQRVLPDAPSTACKWLIGGAIVVERGDLEMLRLLHQAAMRATPAAQLCLDQPSARGRTPIMSACQLG